MYTVVQLSTLVLHEDIVYSQILLINWEDRFCLNSIESILLLRQKINKQNKENYSLIVKKSFFSTKNV